MNQLRHEATGSDRAAETENTNETEGAAIYRHRHLSETL